MKLRINFDLFNEIMNVNNEYSAMKVIRNNKKLYAIYIPAFFVCNYASLRSVSTSLTILPLEALMIFGFDALSKYVEGYDFYKKESIQRLKELVPKLNDTLNLNVDYGLLLESELDSKKYNIQINKSILPTILETKYILVSTVDFNGHQKNISLMQEHLVGSNDYDLSVGSKKKELKLEYSNI